MDESTLVKQVRPVFENTDLSPNEKIEQWDFFKKAPPVFPIVDIPIGMRGTQRQLLAYLEIAVHAREQMHPQRTTPYVCSEDLILRHGNTFQRSKNQPPVNPIPRACFDLAYRLCTRRNALWIYCEGFALSNLGLVAHHAWVTPRKHPGEAYDLAWGLDRHEDAAYMGCMFQAEFVRETFKASGKSKCLSVLDTWWMDYPLLTGKVKIDDVLWKA